MEQEKSPTLLQSFIETCSLPSGCILDLTMNSNMGFLILP
jgi:hypothetical protein